MSNHAVCDLMAENGRLQEMIDDLVKALEAMLEKHGGLEISPAARQANAALARAKGEA